MKSIILASGSVQRKNLLKILGFKFKVIQSQVEEETKIKNNCVGLITHNALMKAEDVARQVKNSIVIGADTVVYVGNKRIIGKPKSLAEARANLKLLMSKPQWVYTGVVLIDSDTGKKVVDYEKTKIFMLSLANHEIDAYHRRVPPFDKAGGFDIEGLGSVFIERIEGCYSNVIGLPLSKLTRMLKKMGVSILSLILMVSLYGCATEYNLATQKQETLMYGTDKEVAIGDAVSRQVEQQYEVITDVDVNERVESILKRIVDVCDRQDIVYFIKVIKDDSMNAVSLPGGYVYVFSGLLDKVKDDEELAGVIAHEIGHINAKHSLKRLQASYGAMVLQLLSTQAGGNVAGGVNLALTTLFMENSQEAEFESDRLAVKYMKKAGYDPMKVSTMLQKLQMEHDKEPLMPHSYWRTHPHIPERIANVNQEITGKLEFKDYIKLIGD